MAPDFVIGRWAGGTRDADGTIQMPWFDYSEETRAFITDAYANHWVVGFDWPGWARTPRGRRLLADPDLITTASPDDLAHVLTVVIRSDRFSEGAVAGAHRTGLLTAIARRASALNAGHRHDTGAPIEGRLDEG